VATGVKVSAATAGAAGISGAATVFLGIPAGVLAAAVLGATISHLPKDGQVETKIPARVLGIVSDTFIGGWLAVAILQFTPLESYGVHNIPAPAVGALCALLVQWGRANVAGLFERAFAAGLAAFNRRFGGTP
jgi:hypothetical protein